MEIIAGLQSRDVLEGDWTRRTVWTQYVLTERKRHALCESAFSHPCLQNVSLGYDRDYAHAYGFSILADGLDHVNSATHKPMVFKFDGCLGFESTVAPLCRVEGFRDYRVCEPYSRFSLYPSIRLTTEEYHVKVSVRNEAAFTGSCRCANLRQSTVPQCPTVYNHPNTSVEDRLFCNHFYGIYPVIL